MTAIPRPKKRYRPDFAIAVINIVFLLLLFYLATGSLIKPEELEADAPLTSELPLEQLPRPLLLVAPDGSLSLDGVALGPRELAEAAARASREAGVLNVLANRSMDGRDFLAILARLDSGGVPLRIVTLHIRGDAGAGR